MRFQLLALLAALAAAPPAAAQIAVTPIRDLAFGPVIGEYVAGRVRGRSDPELDEQFVIPEELPEEPPGDE